jgi:hypothetical protein
VNNDLRPNKRSLVIPGVDQQTDSTVVEDFEVWSAQRTDAIKKAFAVKIAQSIVEAKVDLDPHRLRSRADTMERPISATIHPLYGSVAHHVA